MTFLKLNPFAVVPHNQYTWPRIAFHAVHVTLGLLGAAVGLWWGWRIAVPVTILTWAVNKCLWWNWGRLGGPGARLINWHVFNPLVTPWDDLSDLCLSLLGMVLPVTIWGLLAMGRPGAWPMLAWCAAFYCAETFNGT